MDKFELLVNKSVMLWKELEAQEVVQMIRDYLNENPFARIEDMEVVCQETVGKENGFYKHTVMYFIREKDYI